MRVALVGAELEENLALRYMASALETRGHGVEIVPFNTEHDTEAAINQITDFRADIAGLSMVFTSRGREFCHFAEALRERGYAGHIIGGGPFATFNCERILEDYLAFDSIGLGEGEELICALAEHLDDVSRVSGLCFRGADGKPIINPATGNPDKLDELPWPKRTSFHSYFGKPIASVLTSRGCWRDCAFCSINAWYKKSGGKKFRIRSAQNIVAELKDLYFNHGIRIFNFQDDNFFLPNPDKAARRFQEIRDALRREGVGRIAIAVKARPDSITTESIRVLDELGLFRVFLGVENASQNALRNLNRKNTVEQILNALKILNDFDVHIAFNLLMFEPHTTLDEILVNLRFIERHIDNPFNFCRAEAYPGTGLERLLMEENRLEGDYFGYDYRLVDRRSEVFHQIANYAFFDRNFSDFGLHYFNMQVDFYFQLLRRFHPAVLSEALRAAVKNFIKQTNLDTFENLSHIYDFVSAGDPDDRFAIQAFARRMRSRVDERSGDLIARGQRLIAWLEDSYETRGKAGTSEDLPSKGFDLPILSCRPTPYLGLDALECLDLVPPGSGWERAELLGVAEAPIPYPAFRARLSEPEADFEG